MINFYCSALQGAKSLLAKPLTCKCFSVRHFRPDYRIHNVKLRINEIWYNVLSHTYQFLFQPIPIPSLPPAFFFSALLLGLGTHFPTLFHLISEILSQTTHFHFFTFPAAPNLTPSWLLNAFFV